MKTKALLWIAHIVLGLICLSAFYTHTQRYQERYQVKNDAYGYMMMAYHYAYNNKISKACEDFTKPCPEEKQLLTYYREPLLPTLFAWFLKLNPKTKNLTREEFFETPGFLNEAVSTTLTSFGWTLVFLSAVIGGLIFYTITSNILFSYGVFYLVSTSPVMSHYAQFLLTENTATLLFSVTILCCLLALKKNSFLFFGLAGVSLGLLSLTRAVFYYTWPIFVLCFLLTWLFDKRKKWHSLVASATVFFLCFYAVVAVWMYRNYVYFDDFKLAQRGGRALTIRMFFNKMNSEELKASFLFWAPHRPSKVLLQERFPENITDRFDRKNPEGFYRSARTYGGTIIDKLGSTKGDKQLKKEAIQTILSDPIQHVLVTASMGFRGMFVERPKKFPNGFTMSQYHINIILFSSLAIVTVIGLITKRYQLVMLTFPALFCFLFHASFSNSRTRYNQPMLLSLWISLSLLGYWIASLVPFLFKKLRNS